MTKRNVAPMTRRLSTCVFAYAKQGSGVRAFSSGKRRNNRNDEGSMLVEVLVALLILVIVFTSAVLALSNMAQQRVAIEQRDRAVRLITEYEELSRVFRCGLIVDKNDDLTVTPTFAQKVSQCDFRSQAGLGSSVNGGDQSFTVTDQTGGGTQEFRVNIRYWWEVPGQNDSPSDCNGIRDKYTDSGLYPNGMLPAILVRAFHIEWDEKGRPVEERLIKKDPVPVDSAVFAVGNRSSFLVSVSSGDIVSFSTTSIGAATPRVSRIVGGTPAFPGQPAECVWFPYLAPDGIDRWVETANEAPVTAAGGFRVL